MEYLLEALTKVLTGILVSKLLGKIGPASSIYLQVYVDLVCKEGAKFMQYFCTTANTYPVQFVFALTL